MVEPFQVFEGQFELLSRKQYNLVGLLRKQIRLVPSLKLHLLTGSNRSNRL